MVKKLSCYPDRTGAKILIKDCGWDKGGEEDCLNIAPDGPVGANGF